MRLFSIVDQDPAPLSDEVFQMVLLIRLTYSISKYTVRKVLMILLVKIGIHTVLSIVYFIKISKCYS